MKTTPVFLGHSAIAVISVLSWDHLTVHLYLDDLLIDSHYSASVTEAALCTDPTKKINCACFKWESLTNEIRGVVLTLVHT